jgi:hypothetical protein
MLRSSVSSGGQPNYCGKRRTEIELKEFYQPVIDIEQPKKK